MFGQLVSPLEDASFPKADRKSFSVGSYLDSSLKALKAEHDGFKGMDKELVEASYDINIRYELEI